LNVRRTSRTATPAALSAEPHWSEQSHLLRTRVPADRLSWLIGTESLTHRVRQACGGRFLVRVLSQGWGRPLRSEARVLQLRGGERCLVREVQLLCDDRPWVFARTIIPATTLSGPQRRLARLGNRPLGAVLFADPSMRRGAVQIAALTARHGMFARATRDLKQRPARIWGRRSVFRVADKPLLVSEIFLPGLGKSV
jgi:chorismate lyase